MLLIPDLNHLLMRYACATETPLGNLHERRCRRRRFVKSCIATLIHQIVEIQCRRVPLNYLCISKRYRSLSVKYLCAIYDASTNRIRPSFSRVVCRSYQQRCHLGCGCVCMRNSVCVCVCDRPSIYDVFTEQAGDSGVKLLSSSC